MAQDPRIGVIGSCVQLIDENGRAERIHSVPIQPALVAWSMLFFNSLVHPAVMMRRNVLEAAGYYPSGCAGGTEDYALFIRLSRVTRMANVNDVLLSYRVWGENMTRRAWQTQERDAARIVGEAIADFCDMRLAPNEVDALRGLAADRYPTTAEGIRTIAEIVTAMKSRYVAGMAFDAADRKAIDLDAGVKLWLLAALAVRHSRPLAFHIMKNAIGMGPAALVKFSGKVALRLQQHVRRSLAR
jgi:hypothetical protein